MESPTPSFAVRETLQHCPVCGGTFHPAFPADVQRCDRCHTYFRSPRPTQEEIKRSYDSGSTFEAWVAEEEERRTLWQRRLKKITAHTPSGDLLDIGTGDGHFLAVACEGGFEVEGTDLSEDGITRSAQRGFTVRHGQLLDIDFGDRRYDVITLWHVLEHVPNPQAVLQRIYSLLKPGGIFAVAVPNEENLLFRHRIGLRRMTNPLDEITWGREIHLTHFQPRTFRAALRGIGFEILDFGVDDIYYFRAPRTPRNLLVLALHKTLSRCLGWHFSKAMYCVCRKPKG